MLPQKRVAQFLGLKKISFWCLVVYMFGWRVSRCVVIRLLDFLLGCLVCGCVVVWLFSCLKGQWVGGWPPGRPRSKLGGERNQKLQYTLHIQDNYTICFQCRFHIFNSSLRTMLTIYSPYLQALFSYWHTMIQTQTWYVGNSIHWFF